MRNLKQLGVATLQLFAKNNLKIKVVFKEEKELDLSQKISEEVEVILWDWYWGSVRKKYYDSPTLGDFLSNGLCEEDNAEALGEKSGLPSFTHIGVSIEVNGEREFHIYNMPNAVARVQAYMFVNKHRHSEWDLEERNKYSDKVSILDGY